MNDASFYTVKVSVCVDTFSIMFMTSSNCPFLIYFCKNFESSLDEQSRSRRSSGVLIFGYKLSPAFLTKICLRRGFWSMNFSVRTGSFSFYLSNISYNYSLPFFPFYKSSTGLPKHLLANFMLKMDFFEVKSLKFLFNIFFFNF